MPLASGKIPVLLPLPGNEGFAARIARRLNAPIAKACFGTSKDDPLAPEFSIAVRGRECAIVCSFDDPENQTLTIQVLAEALIDAGAQHVGLVAPFIEGLPRSVGLARAVEIIMTRLSTGAFARAFNWVVTVEPTCLDSGRARGWLNIPTLIVDPTKLIGDWLRQHVKRPVLIGLEPASAQWIGTLSDLARAPHEMMVRKQRWLRSDVALLPPGLAACAGRVPVFVGATLSDCDGLGQAVSARLVGMGFRAAYCLLVHAADRSSMVPESTGSLSWNVVTTNTLASPYSHIDVTELVVRGMRERVN